MRQRSALDLFRLSGDFFAGDSWRAWRACLGAMFGLRDKLTADDVRLVEQCLARAVPTEASREVFLICGRRAGKSSIAAFLAVFLAVFGRHRLRRGELGVLMVLAADRRQARVVKKYISALLKSVPILTGLVARETRDTITLTNGIQIEIHTSNFRAVRGYTIVGCIADEIAFWPSDESANPDIEVLNAIRPAMATCPDAMLIAISSPYARRGALWSAFRDHFGKVGPVFVWQAASVTMNPSIPASTINRAFAEDASAAAAEWNAEFRRDIESFLSLDAIERVIVPGRRELPPVPGVEYVGFLDFAGGSGGDSATLAIGHRHGDVAILDALREVRPPFSPEQTCEEFAGLCARYGVSRCRSDRWAGLFPVEAMGKFGVEVEPSPLAKSGIYTEALAVVNSGRCELPDVPRLTTQLSQLERRVARGGKDSIDHPPNAHDDLANAAMGAVLLALETAGPVLDAAWTQEWQQVQREAREDGGDDDDAIGFDPFDPSGMGMQTKWTRKL